MSVLSAIASGIGSIVSGYGQKKAAEAQLQGTRETNELNYKIWQEEQAYNKEMYELQRQDTWDMWNAENAYNDPSQQIQRLQSAGLNPYLAISGVQGNTAGSMSTPSANATRAPTMQAPGPEAYYNGFQAVGGTLSSVIDLVGKLSQIDNTNADTKNKDKDTELKEAQKEGVISEAELKKVQTERAKFDLNFEKEVRDLKEEAIREGINATRQQIAESKARTALINLNADAQQVLNDWLPAEKQMQYMTQVQQLFNLQQEGFLTQKQVEEIGAKILVYNSQIRLNNAQASYYDTLEVGASLDNAGKRISNSLARSTFNACYLSVLSNSLLDYNNYKFNDETFGIRKGILRSQRQLLRTQIGKMKNDDTRDWIDTGLDIIKTPSEIFKNVSSAIGDFIPF